MEKSDVLPERNKNTNLEKKLKENGRWRRMKKRNKN
jgi:hypothetical protein